MIPSEDDIRKTSAFVLLLRRACYCLCASENQPLDIFNDFMLTFIFLLVDETSSLFLRCFEKKPGNQRPRRSKSLRSSHIFYTLNQSARTVF